MKLRAIFFDGVMFLLWGFLCLFYSARFSFNILLSSLGVIFGPVFGVGVTLIRLNSLEKNGEFRATLKTLALALLTIIILVPIALYLLFTFGLEFGFQMVSFLYPFIPALYAARIVLYMNCMHAMNNLF